MERLRLIVDFTLETREATIQWDDMFQVLKEKTVTQNTIYIHWSNWFSQGCFLRAPITKHRRLGGLYTTEIYFSQLWKPEVWGQGASLVQFGWRRCPVPRTAGFSAAEGPQQTADREVSSPTACVSALIPLVGTPASRPHLPELPTKGFIL